jgi:hypothetical protein
MDKYLIYYFSIVTGSSKSEELLYVKQSLRKLTVKKTNERTQQYNKLATVISCFCFNHYRLKLCFHSLNKHLSVCYMLQGWKNMKSSLSGWCPKWIPERFETDINHIIKVQIIKFGENTDGATNLKQIFIKDVIWTASQILRAYLAKKLVGRGREVF